MKFLVKNEWFNRISDDWRLIEDATTFRITLQAIGLWTFNIYMNVMNMLGYVYTLCLLSMFENKINSETHLAASNHKSTRTERKHTHFEAHSVLFFFRLQSVYRMTWRKQLNQNKGNAISWELNCFCILQANLYLLHDSKKKEFFSYYVSVVWYPVQISAQVNYHYSNV